jgi:RNA polymerase sigma factor (sigma-70 family)
MVLNAARRVVGNPHDSEDVLQATFMVLAQKARLVTNRDALASWLYRVAYRISLKAKARNDRRRHTEKQVDLMSHFPSPPQAGRDWEAVLDEEINRLPEKYRLPIILCELEGRSRKEVEQQLQLVAGTLASRLARAKRMLADRLTRRGVVLAGGALWAVAPQATAGLPATLVAATAHKAVLVAAGQLGAVSSSVSVLMKAGVKAMFIAKLKATVATVVVLASLGAASLVYSGGGGTQTGPAKPQSELEKLRKENELLRVNLRVTLEKIQLLENRVRSLKGRGEASAALLTEQELELLERLAIAHQQAPADTNAQKQPPADNKDAASRLWRGTQTTQPRSHANAKMPPTGSDKDAASRSPLNNTERAVQEFSRSLGLYTQLKERKDGAADSAEALRRAVQTLEQLLKQLRDVEDNRSDPTGKK